MKLSQILQGSRGELSSRRTGFFVALGLFSLAFVTNLFTGKMVNEHLLEYNFYLIIAGLTAIGYDQFMSAKRGTPNPSEGGEKTGK